MRSWRPRLACGLLSTAMAVGALAPPAFAQGTPAAPATPSAPASTAATAANPQTATLGQFPTNLAGFSWSASADVSATATSNGRGLPTGASTALGKTGPDEIGTGRLNVTLHDHTARFQGDLDYTLTADAYVRQSQRDRIGHDLDATSMTVLVPEYLKMDLRAYARQIYVNLLGALGASDNSAAGGGANSGLRQSFGYTAAPDLTFRFGDFAKSDTTVTNSGIFFIRPNGHSAASVPDGSIPNSTLSYGATETISNGTDFDRLNWSLIANARKSERNIGNYSEVSEIAQANYAVSPEFHLLGNAGYEGIASAQKLTRNLRGLTAMGGFEYTPSPNLDLKLEAGQQFNSPSYIGDLTYKISPATSLTGSLTDSVQTPAEQLLQNLSSGTGGDTSGTGLDQPGPASGDGLGITNDISRYRSAKLSFEHDDGRTHYTLSGFGTVRDRLTVSTSGSVPARQEYYGATISVTRNFTPVLNGTVDVTYSIHNIIGGRLNLLRTNFEMNYDVTEKSHLYMRAAYLHRLSSTALVAVSPLSASLTDISATVGLREDLF